MAVVDARRAGSVRSAKLPSGEPVPVLGQGTWGFAENPRSRSSEIATLRLGLDLGMTLVDTAEMYADGAAEALVGEAIAGQRDEVFLVSKVLPDNATRQGTIEACERSLRRLKTDRLDLYLLHWRGAVPLDETIEGFAALARAGKIRHWGVSNFDVPDMIEVVGLADDDVSTDQVLYNPSRRGIEYDLMPWCQLHHIPIMAYSPIERGRLLRSPVLNDIAARHQSTAATVALAWVLRQDGVIAIPKASSKVHVRENRMAPDLRLTEQDLADLDRAFPPSAGPRPLEMI
jgi:diketogulonate reductase-like aldo/keto reductase